MAAPTEANAPIRIPNLLSLAWPVAAEQILNMSLFWADSIIINHKLGTEAFAAVQIGATIFNMIGLVIFIVAAGTSIVVSHQIGAGERRGAAETGAQSVTVGLLLSVGLGGVIWLVSPFLLRLLGATGGVYTQGLAFNHVLSAFMPAMALLAVLSATIRATGDTRGPMMVTFLVNILNVVLNYLFVYGTPAVHLGGFTLQAIGGGMGITGSALGTSLGRTIGVLLLFAMLLRKSDLPLRLRDFLLLKGRTLYRVARMGVPGALEQIAWEGGQFAHSVIVAPLGTAVIAARALAFQVDWFTLLPSMALEVAVSIVVGQLIGARLRERAVAEGRKAILYGIVTLSTLSLVMWLLARPVLTLFTRDEAVLVHAVSALKIAALYKAGQCLNVVCGGIFRGAGNPQWPTVLTMLFTWFFAVPAAYLVVRLGYGLTGILWVMFSDEMMRGAINLWYFTTPRWRNREV
ncbi:MAG TPA: MATE family efflux transporter [Symbiobacteriaceae bacterium]|jgi:putative MATE family efflux protein|nr:MATE family efflux transporter [Symbiobacteriaceae bacterium]